jgi:hypothetical protein
MVWRKGQAYSRDRVLAADGRSRGGDSLWCQRFLYREGPAAVSPGW